MLDSPNTNNPNNQKKIPKVTISNTRVGIFDIITGKSINTNITNAAKIIGISRRKLIEHKKDNVRLIKNYFLSFDVTIIPNKTSRPNKK